MIAVDLPGLALGLVLLPAGPSIPNQTTLVDLFFELLSAVLVAAFFLPAGGRNTPPDGATST